MERSCRPLLKPCQERWRPGDGFTGCADGRLLMGQCHSSKRMTHWRSENEVVAMAQPVKADVINQG